VTQTRCFGKQRDVRTYTRVPLMRGKITVNEGNTRSSITYAAGSSLILSYKGILSEKVVDYYDRLTLANARNITSTICEVNMTRK